ncbi:MAG: bifunctional glutamate N-acetyltransferase/amino-acid acetyltransferase ArgJ [Phycisphaerales bacterium]
MSITRPIGFRAASTTAGIKPSGKPDLALIVRDEVAGALAASAAVFTQNAMLGAPVTIGMAQRQMVLAGRQPAHRAILINAGNSNAATGEKGLADAHACMIAVAERLGCGPSEVLPSSTGVIGRLLPVEKIVRAVPALVGALDRGDAADAGAAGAIMTTDLVPKTAAREVEIAGRRVRLGAIAKGSGMIAPRLESAAGPMTPSATMLAFVTSDIAIRAGALQDLLGRIARETFNRISVDNHPSCSDTLVCLTSGAAGSEEGAAAMTPVALRSAEIEAFAGALHGLCEDLSNQIVVDGEGATRTFRIEVRGAPGDEAAEAMAREVVNSPLVKCAIHGRDPNWGRIVTAAGNAGVRFDPAQASLRIGPVEVYRAGVPVMEALKDERLARAMSEQRVELVLSVGAGPGTAWMIGCDLSADYVRINADYTT